MRTKDGRQGGEGSLLSWKGESRYWYHTDLPGFPLCPILPLVACSAATTILPTLRASNLTSNAFAPTQKGMPVAI